MHLFKKHKAAKDQAGNPAAQQTGATNDPSGVSNDPVDNNNNVGSNVNNPDVQAAGVGANAQAKRAVRPELYESSPSNRSLPQDSKYEDNNSNFNSSNYRASTPPNMGGVGYRGEGEEGDDNQNLPHDSDYTDNNSNFNSSNYQDDTTGNMGGVGMGGRS